ncbi:MAG: PKD domain-containing protein [Bacteroidia bacterium]|jgi:PKD repeat protein
MNNFTNQLKSAAKSFLFLLFLCWSFPSFSICPITGDTTVCAGDINTYSTSLSGPYTYQWNAYGGVATGGGTSVSVAWGNTASGQVTLIVRDVTNNIVCTSLLNVTIMSKPMPWILPSVMVGCGGGKADTQGRKDDECLNVCDSTWVTYSTPNHSGSSYTWVITGTASFTPSTSNSIQVYWTGAGSGSVQVTETNVNGCVGTDQVCVKIIEKPHALYTSLNTPVAGIINACKNQPIQFIDQSFAGAGTPLLSWEWQWGDATTTAGTYPGSADATHAYSTAGTYQVMLIVENECHCKDTFIRTVQISSNPGPDIFCISTVCPDAIVTYHTNTACPTAVYHWSVTNGTIQGDSTDSVVTVMWGSTGPGIITLAVTGCAGICTTPTSVFVPIIVPNAQIMGKALVCAGECETYHISCDIPIDSIIWHVPPGVTVITDTINVHEIQLCFYNFTFTSGNIFVEYYHKIPGSTEGMACGGQAILTIKQRPRLFLSAQPGICDKSVLTVFPSPPTAASLQWIITNQTGNITYFTSVLPSSSNLTLNWIYGPGNFVIHAKDSTGRYCNSPQQINLKVNPLPPEPDSISGPQPVCPGIPYTYLAFQTASNLSVMWTVQNGTPVSGAGNTISVVWNATGPYILGAVQVDPITGCASDTLRDTIPSILPLAPSPILGDTSGCANNNTTHSLNVPGDDFVWSITPAIAGSVISGQHTSNITIEWNNYSGSATITVIRKVCGQSITLNKTILINMPPVPAITAPLTVCAGVGVNMSAAPAALSYNWNFGDGFTSTLANPSHIYQSAGNFIISLTVTYGGNCVGTATTTKSIMINPKPNITISTPDPNIFCGPVGTVNMFVAGPVSGVTYNWFRSPSVSLTTGTSYSSNVLGSYYVIGVNGYGCADTSNFIPIDTLCDTCSANPAYTVDFNRLRLGCNKDTFMGIYTVGALNPRWNFDDPFSGSNTATGNNATHTFSEPGYYRVMFCVDVPNTSGTGLCKICKMKVDTVQYVPDFYDSLYCVSGIDSVKIKFINNTKRLSTLPVPSYSWLVNPGGYTSTQVNPLFSLPPGNYTVSLTVAGTCVITKNITIPGFPNATFTTNDSVCVLAGITFNNTSTGSFTQSAWNFGDGATSLVNSPTRVYSTSGLFTAVLKITNAFGCIDSTIKSIRVLPNTLFGIISAFGDTVLCEGDSVQLIVNTTGGYPAYNYLWSNLNTTSSIYAKYTGAYYVDITDSKACFYKTDLRNIYVNPVPRPQISGLHHLCVNDQQVFAVNYPASGYTITWKLDTTIQTGFTTLFNFFAAFPTIGTHTLSVTVVSSDGCIGKDSFQFEVHALPNASISSTGNLCEGQLNLLVGTTTSSNIINTYWNTGLMNDTLYTSVPGSYTYTVVDSFGCKATATSVVNPLPDFCGMLTGCYEICDSIQQLVWFAPPGYAAYQWYYNGNPIPGSTADTIHIPLYQAGIYQVLITTAQGCKKMSEPIELSFVKCGECAMHVVPDIHCGPVNSSGQQTYTITMSVNNTLGAGAGINVNTGSGSVTGLSPAILVAGSNTVTFTFTDLAPFDTMACFTLVIFHGNTKCDTLICIKLPPCKGKCQEKVTIKKIDCAGYDALGHPMYSLCADITWGGSSGASLTVSTPSGTFSPNPVTITTGLQSVCFTYIDLPPYTGNSTFYFNFFDPATGLNCVDSVKMDYEPCRDSCRVSVYGLCAHCKFKEKGITTYNVEVTVYNPFSLATVSILPVSSGVFGAISPNPLAAGMQTFNVLFTDSLPADTIICFRVVLNDGGGKTCWEDVCVYLPPCDHTGLDATLADKIHIAIAPNPARDKFTVYYSVPVTNEAFSMEITDISGKVIQQKVLDNRNGIQEFSNFEMSEGLYFVNIKTPTRSLGTQRLVIIK